MRYLLTFLPADGEIMARSGFLLVGALDLILLAAHFLGSLDPFVPVGRLVLFEGLVPAVPLGFAAPDQVDMKVWHQLVSSLGTVLPVVLAGRPCEGLVSNAAFRLVVLLQMKG